MSLRGLWDVVFRVWGLRARAESFGCKFRVCYRGKVSGSGLRVWSLGNLRV